MIIRIIAMVSLACLLIMVLYVPSVHPPEYFISQLHAEQEMNAKFWGNDFAAHILTRMLELHADATQAFPIMETPSKASMPNAAEPAAATQMSDMNARLFQSPYFKSIGALLILAIYRFAVLLEWLPTVLVFALAATFDGAIRRIVKSKEFLQHNPEMYALFVSMIIMLACGIIVAFIIPLTLHPIVLATVPVCIGLFAGVAVANFHCRG